MNKSRKDFVTTTCAAHRPPRAAVCGPWDRRREVRVANGEPTLANPQPASQLPSRRM